jgi:hypothetical protein
MLPLKKRPKLTLVLPPPPCDVPGCDSPWLFVTAPKGKPPTRRRCWAHARV